MKKILSLILVCLTLFSMAACSIEENNNVWKTRNVSKPDIEMSVKDVQFTLNGETQNDRVVVTPFAIDRAAKSVETIKNLNCMHGWQVAVSDSLYGMPIADTNVTTYQKGYRATFYQDNYEGEVLTIEYMTDTDTFEGWSRVYVQWTTNNNNDPINQKNVFEVLKAVYGNCAEYMCYAKMTGEDGYVISSIQNGESAVTFSRETCNTGVYFTLTFTSVASGVTGNPGNVVFPVSKVEPFVTLLKWDDNEAMLANMSNFGQDFFQKFYGTKATFQPTAPYTFTKEQTPLNAEGKQNREGLMLIGKINGTSSVEAPSLFYTCHQYSSGHYELTLRLGVAIEKAGPDKEEQIAELRAHALKMVQKIVPDATDACFAEDYRADIRLCEYEAAAKFRFYCDTDENGNLSAELLVVASTNPEDFN